MAKGRTPRGQTVAQQRGPAATDPDDFGRPLPSDVRRLKREARGRDAENRAAYNAGLEGTAQREAYDGDAELQAAFDAGEEERRTGRPKPSGDKRQRTRIGPTGQLEPSSYRPPATVSDGAGLLVGAIAYALALAYIKYGPAGVTSWLSAKFINKPTLGPAAGGSGAVNAPGSGVTGSVPGPGGTNVLPGTPAGPGLYTGPHTPPYYGTNPPVIS